MTDKRVVILENGTATIGGVEYVLVPKAADTKLLFRMRDQHWKSSGCQFTLSDYAEAHTAMLSAAAIDLSGLPRVKTVNELGSIPVTATWSNTDNLGIALCCYFSDVHERPKDDPDTERGWGEWVEMQANAMLARILDAIGVPK